MKFWMVLGRGVPVFRHPAVQDAKKEAERLARLDPGQVFTVLESVGEVVKSDLKWESHGDNSGSDIPF